MNNTFKVAGHFYVPIPAFNGSVLKYESGVTKGNRSWLVAKHPDGIILDDYNGDRVNAADHSEYSARQGVIACS